MSITVARAHPCFVIFDERTVYSDFVRADKCWTQPKSPHIIGTVCRRQEQVTAFAQCLNPGGRAANSVDFVGVCRDDESSSRHRPWRSAANLHERGVAAAALGESAPK